jgi:hypothetical protein
MSTLHRFQTAMLCLLHSGTHNNQLSTQTDRNRLPDDGLCGRGPYFDCVLTGCQRVIRVTWAQTHFRRIRQQWTSAYLLSKSMVI